LCADLIGAYDDVEYSDFRFKNTEELTMFADYRVPQILRHLQIFEYSEDLAYLIDSEQEMPYSSDDEV